MAYGLKASSCDPLIDGQSIPLLCVFSLSNEESQTSITTVVCSRLVDFVSCINGSQLAKMKKSIPDKSLP